jgi:tRNA-dihydrouridine synthase
VREARKHVSWYISGIRGAAEFRHRINSAESLDEIKRIADEISETAKE